MQLSMQLATSLQTATAHGLHRANCTVFTNQVTVTGIKHAAPHGMKW
jgi:hypothetical protein